MNVAQGRRPFLLICGALALAAVPPLARAQLAQPQLQSCRLSLVHTHTGERLEIVYAEGGAYVPKALGRLNRFLRDHYTGQVGVMDPRLFDQLHQVQALRAAQVRSR